MYRELGDIKLKSGETVQSGLVTAPDREWEARIVKLLSHKGEPWNWQNAQVLREDTGVEARFYVAHRDGRPLANVMTVQVAGAGCLGHVFTVPEDRRKGAITHIMARQMDDFRARGGEALFLGTGFDSAAYHIYRRFGFRGVEAGSGDMEYYATSRKDFEATYFAPGEAEILPADWRYWPASGALFLGDFPGRVRCAPLKLFGRALTEGSMLSVIRREGERREGGEPPRVLALQSRASTAVVGLAAWAEHPLWPHTCLLDVYCHPNWWHLAAELIGSLSLPDADRCVAYGDPTCPAKIDALAAVGFQQTGTIPNRLATDCAKTGFVDALALERQ